MRLYVSYCRIRFVRSSYCCSFFSFVLSLSLLFYYYFSFTCLYSPSFLVWFPHFFVLFSSPYLYLPPLVKFDTHTWGRNVLDFHSCDFTLPTVSFFIQFVLRQRLSFFRRKRHSPLPHRGRNEKKKKKKRKKKEGWWKVEEERRLCQTAKKVKDGGKKSERTRWKKTTAWYKI